MKWIAAIAIGAFCQAGSIAAAPKPIGEIKVDVLANESIVLKITNKGTKNSTIQKIQVRNAWKGALEVEFIEQGSTCMPGVILAPNESCTFKYKFVPAAKGSKMMTLHVTTTAEEYIIQMRGVAKK